MFFNTLSSAASAGSPSSSRLRYSTWFSDCGSLLQLFDVGFSLYRGQLIILWSLMAYFKLSDTIVFYKTQNQFSKVSLTSYGCCLVSITFGASLFDGIWHPFIAFDIWNESCCLTIFGGSTTFLSFYSIYLMKSLLWFSPIPFKKAWPCSVSWPWSNFPWLPQLVIFDVGSFMETLLPPMEDMELLLGLGSSWCWTYVWSMFIQ